MPGFGTSGPSGNDEPWFTGWGEVNWQSNGLESTCAISTLWSQYWSNMVIDHNMHSFCHCLCVCWHWLAYLSNFSIFSYKT
jgi:hypothetical protein